MQVAVLGGGRRLGNKVSKVRPEIADEVDDADRHLAFLPDSHGDRRRHGKRLEEPLKPRQRGPRLEADRREPTSTCGAASARLDHTVRSRQWPSLFLPEGCEEVLED